MIDHLKHMADVRPGGIDRDAVTWALAEIERLRAALTNAQEKLKVYWKERPSHEYTGGMEFGHLMREIDAALTVEQKVRREEK